jgi:hypothetical protein
MGAVIPAKYARPLLLASCAAVLAVRYADVALAGVDEVADLLRVR